MPWQMPATLYWTMRETNNQAVFGSLTVLITLIASAERGTLSEIAWMAPERRVV
jgi:hypothetical protein